ncbi:MAG TPA: SulP family inorganic anion transporter [Methylothermaceae bacterium]|nr:SulP family inorganic anion transporter [Methylothermaceae bacterium]
MQSLEPHRNDDAFSVWNNLRHDLPAGIVVFLVAVPLCLGIALASGAPLSSGIIAGFIGGLVVPLISRSPLGVSGPAAGLAVIVYDAIQDLGFQPFLLAVVFAGVIQVILGLLRAGIIGYYFPSSVIIGMLSGIGIIIVLKQIPHAVGYDADWEGDLAYHEPGGETTLQALMDMFGAFHPGATIIAVISLAILILWEQPFMKRRRIFQLVQGPLVAVIIGSALNLLFQRFYPGLALEAQHLVQLPVAEGMEGIRQFFTIPDFTAFTNRSIYTAALVIALVASIETLLCVEATDKLDPFKRVTPTNRELIAQGVANSVSGLVGGLPITQVIVRSSTNILAGARTKAAAFIHGLFLLIFALMFPHLLNLIPLATLAAILFVVGYKLAKPELFVRMYRQGLYQFTPFMVTILGLVFTDLLTGVGIGMVTALFFILLEHYKCGVYLHQSREDNKIILRLSEQVTFLNKANLLRTLDRLPPRSEVVIDGSETRYIDHDALEIIENFKAEAAAKHIKLTIVGLPITTSEEEKSHETAETSV